MRSMSRALIGMTVAVLALGTIGCTPAEEDADREQAEAVYWGYEGEEGPERWAELSEEFALCGSGTRQSPIDLAAAAPMAAGTGPGLLIDVSIAEVAGAGRGHVVDVLDNGHTIQVAYDEGSTVTAGGVEYHFLQFHVHAPSEHTIDGRHFPMDVHLVHQSDAGDLLVLGAFIEEGESNAAFQTLIDGLPSAPGEERRLENVEIGVDAFIPSTDEYYRYEGSLTTPPCSEGVRWVVFTEPLQASAEQIAALDAAMPENNRPVQPLGSREVVLITR